MLRSKFVFRGRWMNFCEKWQKWHFSQKFIHLPRKSEYEFRTKHHRNILRPYFESLGSILSISNFIFIFWCLFVTQTVSSVWTGSFSGSQVIYRFGCKKAWKTQNFVSTNSYLESMHQGLSTSGLRMSIRPLVMILCQLVCLPKMRKKEVGGS